MFLNLNVLNTLNIKLLISKDLNKNIICTMDDVNQSKFNFNKTVKFHGKHHKSFNTTTVCVQFHVRLTDNMKRRHGKYTARNVARTSKFVGTLSRMSTEHSKGS